MSESKSVEIGSIVGEVLAHIDIDIREKEQNQIRLTTASGRVITITHDQDCCEHVRIAGFDGDMTTLIGRVIIEATQEETDGSNLEEYESRTDTKLTFRTDSNTVVSRWIGTSNGYYSERVDLWEIVK